MTHTYNSTKTLDGSIIQRKCEMVSELSMILNYYTKVVHNQVHNLQTKDSVNSRNC